jgi:hypothetical protein
MHQRPLVDTVCGRPLCACPGQAGVDPGADIPPGRPQTPTTGDYPLGRVQGEDFTTEDLG